MSHPASPLASYSYLNAIIGSTREARCAGTKPARIETTDRVTAEMARTHGSDPFMSYSSGPAWLYRYSGRDFRLTDVAGTVIREILA